MSIETIVIAILGFVGIGGLSYFMGRSNGKKALEAGKTIGRSESNDNNREDAANNAGEQVGENEDVIKESEEAIERAQNVLKEARDKVRKLREKTSNTSGDGSSSS